MRAAGGRAGGRADGRAETNILPNPNPLKVKARILEILKSWQEFKNSRFQEFKVETFSRIQEFKVDKDSRIQEFWSLNKSLDPRYGCALLPFECRRFYASRLPYCQGSLWVHVITLRMSTALWTKAKYLIAKATVLPRNYCNKKALKKHQIYIEHKF